MKGRSLKCILPLLSILSGGPGTAHHTTQPVVHSLHHRIMNITNGISLTKNKVRNLVAKYTVTYKSTYFINGKAKSQTESTFL